MSKLKYTLIFLSCCFLTQAISLDLPAIDPNVYKWTNFIEALQSQEGGKIPPPFPPVELLAEKYLQPGSVVLDIGCETGKNAASLIKNCHKVVLLDIASNALSYTIANLSREGLSHGVLDSLNVQIEEFQLEHAPFQAVIGTHAFSFIPPKLFDATIKKKIFDCIEIGGYFVGGFFGEQHAWADRPEMSIFSFERLETLFISSGFRLIELSEVTQEERLTISGEFVRFHTFNIIAQ
ncbi:MAG: class I SAM-dependent methyltransferase, partial [Chlamydiota bacterium]